MLHIVSVSVEKFTITAFTIQPLYYNL